MRRLVAGGGAKLNDVKIEDAALVVSKDTFGEASEIKVASPLRPHPYAPFPLRPHPYPCPTPPLP